MHKYLIGCILLSQLACYKGKPEDVPAFIYIDELKVQTLVGEGTAKHDLPDAWVYVDDQPVGVFALPARIPILAEGVHKISVFGGVIKDGISSTRIKYPFLQPYVNTTINLQRGHIDSLSGSNSPVLTYYPSSEIAIWEEAFDDPGIDFQADVTSEGQLVFHNTPSEVFEGVGSGLVELNSSQSLAYFITTQSFTLPKNGKQVYLELHYNTNNEMTVGFQAINGGDINTVNNVRIRSSDGQWKKIYVDYTDLASVQTNATSFKFYFTIVKETSGSTVYNLIDNFKIVYAK